MINRMTEEERRRAEQIVRRWLWATGLSSPTDRSVEQSTIGELAVDLLTQLLMDDCRRSTRSDAA